MNFILTGFSVLWMAFVIAPAQAAGNSNLTIHAAEFGIGKFHRHDNKVHPYGSDNAWANFILPDNARADGASTLVVENANGSITIFFSSLEALLDQMQKISKEKNAKIGVFNLNAHGLPGAMWFPNSPKTLNSSACKSWRAAAHGEDAANYDQYYSAVSKSEIKEMRLMAKLPSMQWSAPCTTGFKQWKMYVDKHPQLPGIFASDAQIHMFSCIVGLGRAGNNFVSKTGELLLKGENAKFEASMNFGLGDWSMPEGMGFWDYLTNSQLNSDNSKYPVNRKDREMAQKGQIRLAIYKTGAWQTGVVENLDYMLGGMDQIELASNLVGDQYGDEDLTREEEDLVRTQGLNLRIPGTAQRFRATLH